MEEMSPETIRALGGRKGLASLDEAKVGLVAEQAKLHAQDKFRQGAVQAAASATGLDADTVGWLGSSVGALDYACDCGWTEDYACPSAEQPGRKGWAHFGEGSMILLFDKTSKCRVGILPISLTRAG